MRLEYYSGTEAFGNDVLDPLLRHEEQNNLLISFARNDRKAETSAGCSQPSKTMPEASC